MVRISCVGGTAVWRRGMSSVLDEGGFEAVEFESLEEWAPGHGGVAVVAASESDDWSAGGFTDFGESFPHIPLIAVVSELGLTSLAAAIRAGAVAVVDDEDQPELVVQVVRSALDGSSLVPVRLVRAMAELVPPSDDAAQLLEPGEVEWIRAMSQGETVAELAERTGYSERAMFRNLRRMYSKIGVRNRTETLIWASRMGLLGPIVDD